MELNVCEYVKNMLVFFGPYGYLLSFAYGAMIGSFLNVLIYRLPLMILGRSSSSAEKVNLFQPSACPRCGKAIAWYTNIPVLSWLILRGKSRCCGGKISSGYFIIEFFSGLIASSCSYYFGFTLQALLVTLLLLALLALFVVDLKNYLLPDMLVAVVFLTGLFASYYGYTVCAIEVNFLGAMGTYGVLYLVSYFYSKHKGFYALGLGDIKLLSSFCMWLGPLAAPIVFMMSIFSMFMLAVPTTAERREGIPKEAVPYGPMLIIGFLIAIIFQSAVHLL